MSRYFMQDTRLAAFEREMMAKPGFGSRRFKDDDDSAQEESVRRGYSKRQVIEMGFPMADYDFPHGEGSFTGTLVMKRWNKQNGLICYFDTDDGYKYKLCVWFKHDEKRAYRPSKSDIDISYIEIGTRLTATYGLTRNGKSKWINVKVLEVPA
ncbi:MAG: hypothetical protein E7446_06535 [Ruminococcaceae bacterium]|nr:hypothetical protein [Oscillospiraceae bacterium]